MLRALLPINLCESLSHVNDSKQIEPIWQKTIHIPGDTMTFTNIFGDLAAFFLVSEIHSINPLLMKTSKHVSVKTTIFNILHLGVS